MPIQSLTTATVLAALTVIFAEDSRDAIRCSLVPFPTRGSDQTLLLGSASADTVLAGAGEVTVAGAGGHVGGGEPGPIFGQVIDVARYAGADSVRLERAFERGGSARVVIVPWDYDATCRPTRWDVGAAWVPVAEPGVFGVRLRPDSLWAGGVPTFDAFMASVQPYPQGRYLPARLRRQGIASHDSVLAPAEYFDLMSAVPAHDELQAAPDVAWSTILEWQVAHPELAAKYPATLMIDMLGRRIAFAKERQALYAIEPIVAGSWRFTFSLDDGPARVFYARTRPRATSVWGDPSAARPAIDPAQPPSRPDGYHLLASGATSADLLPVDCEGDRDIHRESYIAALEPPLAGEERTEWSGMVDLRLPGKQFPDDSVLSVFVRQSMMQSATRSRDSGRFAPARYTLGDDGVLRVEQTVRLDDGRSVVLRGERVSMDVIACES